MPNPRDDQQGYFRKRGILTRSRVQERPNFVGRGARTTFGAMEERQAARFTSGNTEVASLGEAYENLFYKESSGSGEKSYEPVYGDTDYSAAVAASASNETLLNEVFGNNDNDPSGGSSAMTSTEAVAVFGRNGQTKTNKSSLTEKNQALRMAQSGLAVQLDEEFVGIRGEEEPDAPIEPIA